MSPRVIHRIFRVYDVVLQAAREDQEGAILRVRLSHLPEAFVQLGEPSTSCWAFRRAYEILRPWDGAVRLTS